MHSQSSVSKSVKKTSSSEKKTKTKVKLDEFDVTKVKFEEIDMKMKGQKQGIGYVRYVYPHGKNNFVLQVDAINMTQYGIPKKEWVEGKRTNFTIPFDPEQEGCNSLENMLTQVDEYTEENKKEILGKFAKLYTYQPIVRESANLDDLITDDDDEDKKKTTEDKVRFKYCKMKLDTTYPDCEIKTGVYVRDPETDKATYTPVANATQLSDYVNWGSEVRMIVMVNKLWAAKNKDKSGTRSYGTTMKILQLDVKPRQSSGSIRNQFSRYAFDDSDNSDEEDDEANDSTEDASVEDDLDAGVEEEVEEVEEDDDDEAEEEEADEDEEEEEEESSEEVVKPKKKKKSKSKK
jgi:hypothetical protein